MQEYGIRRRCFFCVALAINDFLKRHKEKLETSLQMQTTTLEEGRRGGEIYALCGSILHTLLAGGGRIDSAG